MLFAALMMILGAIADMIVLKFLCFFWQVRKEWNNGLLRKVGPLVRVGDA
jgi:hypothetical protein